MSPVNENSECPLCQSASAYDPAMPTLDLSCQPVKIPTGRRKMGRHCLDLFSSMPANLPGFYFDEQRNRYFPITSRGGTPSVREPAGKPASPVLPHLIPKKGRHASVQHRIREATTGLYASQHAKALRWVIILSPPTQSKNDPCIPYMRLAFLYIALATRESVWYKNATEYGIVNPWLQNLVGLPRKTRPERLRAAPSLGYNTSTCCRYSCAFLLDKYKKHKSLGPDARRG